MLYFVLYGFCKNGVLCQCYVQKSKQTLEKQLNEVLVNEKEIFKKSINNIFFNIIRL